MSKPRLPGDTLSFKPVDFLKFSTIFANEYNSPELHDRVLVFDIVKDESIDENVLTTIGCIGSTEADSAIIAHEDKGTYGKRLRERKLPCSRKEQKYELSEIVQEEHEIELKEEVEPGEHEEGSNKIKISSRLGKRRQTAAKKDIIIVAGDSDKPESPSTEDGVTNPTNEVLRQHKIFVHACWLAVHSTYFRSLFFSGMKESLSKEVHLTVPESEEKGHLLLLKAIYNPTALHNISVDKLLAVLELADKYNVELVFNKCKYVLQAKTLSLEVCEKIMFVVQVKHSMTNIRDLVYTIETFVAKVFSPLDRKWQTKNFENLSEPLLKCLLSSNQLITQSENTVFHALMHWIEYNDYDPSAASTCTISLGSASPTSLLSLVRFRLLTFDYLYNVVHHHPVATKMAGFSQFYLEGVTYHALPATVKERMSDWEKPDKRCECTDEIVQYTWVMKFAKLRNLANEANILSELFWWCGYKMQMSLKRINGSFKFLLSACDLTGNSEIRVLWRCKGILDQYSYMTSDLSQTHTFSEDEPDAESRYFSLHNLNNEFLSIDISLVASR